MKIVAILIAAAALASAFSSCKKEINIVEQPVEETVLTDDDSELIISNNLIRNQTHIITDFNQNMGGYLLSKPFDYNSTKKNYPLLISFHGIGKRGNGRSDIYKITRNSIPRLIQLGAFPKTFRVNGENFSFIVISPQFKEFPEPEDIDQLIEHAVKTYRVDAKRIYLVGISMGGGAVSVFSGTHPEKVAAVVPLAESRIMRTDQAERIAKAKLPIWAFHNRFDPVVPSYKTIHFIRMVRDHYKKDDEHNGDHGHHHNDDGDHNNHNGHGDHGHYGNHGHHENKRGNNHGNNHGHEHGHDHGNYHDDIRVKETIFDYAVHNCWARATNPDFKQDDMNIYEWMLQFKRD